MQPEVIAERRKRKNPRSRTDIAIEILRLIRKKGEKRTKISNKTEINYILATELTNCMENKMKWIKRDKDGIYTITTEGEKYLGYVDALLNLGRKAEVVIE
jgi:predicted transcriptional regulator